MTDPFACRQMCAGQRQRQLRRLCAAATAATALLVWILAAPAAAERRPSLEPVSRVWAGVEISSLDPAPLPGSGLLTASRRSNATGVRPPRRSDPAPSGTGDSSDDAALSDERTFTRWAYVAKMGPILRHPGSPSERVTRLRRYTEDGFPEVYLLLDAHWQTDGQEWIRIRIPARPNGQTGWVRADDLGRFHITYKAITVNRARLRMYLYRHGHRIWSAPVAVGKPSTPTPPGHFWIRERFKITDRSSGYWPYAFGTSDYSTLTDWPGGGVIGIHGPYHQPRDIPGRVSHGCIRLRVKDDAWLAHHIGLGTPISVS